MRLPLFTLEAPGWRNAAFLWCWLMLQCCAFASHVIAADKRYVVRFSDGSYHTGDKLVNWHAENAQPQVDGRSLLTDANPFRWVRDRAQSPGEAPAAAVEMITGDVLPGEVLEYAAPNQPWSPEPGTFWVQPSVPFDPPETASRSTVRLVANHVKRIVWQRQHPEVTTPKTLKLRDGSTFAYRALRWETNSVQVLLPTGTRRFEFAELAEINLERTAFWPTYQNELALLVASEKSRLLNVETVHGLTLTASTERFSIQSRGNHEEPHKWQHGLQPAWSLDLLWVPVESIWMWRSFAPHEVPLHNIPVEKVQHTSVLQPFTTPWRRDRNIRGEWLRSGNREIGFGLGTGTTTTLTFALPAEAREVQGMVGLDRLAGSGGCAKVSLAAGEKDVKTLWESPLLVGSSHTHDFGTIKLPVSENAGRLELHAQAAPSDRPTGADPFEVRDYIDWIDPIVVLDRPLWSQRIRSTAPIMQLAGEAWKLDLPPTSTSPFVNVLDQRAPQPRQFLPAIAMGESFAWRQTVNLSKQSQWLLVYLHRLNDSEPAPQLEVRMAGELIGSALILRRDDAQHRERPHVFPIADFAQAMEQADVEIRVRNASPKSPLLLRAAFVSESLPFVHNVFNGSHLPPAAEGSSQPPQWLSAEVESPTAALKILAGNGTTFTFDPPLKIRSYPTSPAVRTLRLMLRSQGCTQLRLKWTGNFETGVAEHIVGKGEKLPGQFRMHHDPLKKEWLQITHDLFNDFGETEITSFSIFVPDGEAALIDKVALADTWEDFLLEEKAYIDSPARAARQLQRVEKSLERAQQCTVRIDFGEGRTGAGVLIGGNNEILTAGHLVRESNRACTVITADGKEHKARTKGVCRDLDIGMVQFEQGAGIHGLGINHWLAPGPQQALSSTTVSNAEFTTTSTEVVRANDQQAWTLPSAKKGALGGALFDKDAQVLGIAHRESVTGGTLFSLLKKWGDIEKRLQNGEVWGEFPK
jgi:Trypsin-like peptidase domain/NPCBM/NEW2 domain